MEKENKKEITGLLCVALKATRAGNDVDSMEYHAQKEGEYVTIRYKNGTEYRCDVTADSGVSLMRDVLSKID